MGLTCNLAAKSKCVMVVIVRSVTFCVQRLFFFFAYMLFFQGLALENSEYCNVVGIMSVSGTSKSHN